MIVTVTPNPAFDRTVVLDELKPGQVNRAKRTRVDLGGKGINVAKNVKAIGGEAVCLGFMGENDVFALIYLNSLGIGHDFTTIRHNIRVNTKIIDEHNSAYTDINEPGPEIAPSEQQNLKQKIKVWSQKANILVLSGSLPPGINYDFYKEVIEEIKFLDIKIILDADKEALKSGIDAGPYMIKPNIHELSELVGKELVFPDEIIQASLRLIQKGISIVAVSMGDRGSITVTADGAFITPALNVKVRGTVGAGDAMVAGFALALDQSLSLTDAVKMAAAASSAAVTREGTEPVDFDTFKALLSQVKIEKVPLNRNAGRFFCL
ncbi:MAG: 1-phosphofructokinase [Thermoanaerobacteraceae bacterium]|nr:1-phosphofructokinase [Thermoanaerobacteraceae bacterium]